VQARLLAWFDASHRDLPWRRTRDPYCILVSEILLQRTRVVLGRPYYERFLARFPDVRSLAAASEEDVLRTWEGLGFYRRARNLHAAAREITVAYRGQVPADFDTLRSLPGVGAYTAGAVASIAFNQRVPAIDGNVARVLARLFRIEEVIARGMGRKRLESIAMDLVPSHRPGAFNQALMELGATVCTPASPDCPICPLERLCIAREADVEVSLPRPPPRRAPEVVSVAFAHVRADERILLVQRPKAGLFGGLWSLPGGEIASNTDAARTLRDVVAAQTGLSVRVGEVTAAIAQTFSHRQWFGSVYSCTMPGDGVPAVGARWASWLEARRLPLVPFQRKFLKSIESHRNLEFFDADPHGPPP
jgi:A/G-specific adenine glycosylase